MTVTVSGHWEIRETIARSRGKRGCSSPAPFLHRRKGTDMIIMQEFEVHADPEGGYAVEPCGLAGATEGDTYEKAVEMAVDWLRVHALAALERGAEFESSGLGHAPSHGGTTVTIAINAELSDIPAVTATEAAEMLGVSTARVAQLCRDGGLNSWKVGSARMVSRDSIECRLAAKPEAGRPRAASAEL